MPNSKSWRQRLRRLATRSRWHRKRPCTPRSSCFKERGRHSCSPLSRFRSSAPPFWIVLPCKPRSFHSTRS
eukprot:33265_4